MDQKQLNQFRIRLRRGLRASGFLFEEAMAIVERAQRMLPDTLKFIPPHLFDIENTLGHIADQKKISRDEAWYLLQEKPELLFTTTRIRTWGQIQEYHLSRYDRENEDTASAPNQKAHEQKWKRPDVRVLQVPGYVPPKPAIDAEKNPRIRGTLSLSRNNAPKTDKRKSTKIVPDDAELTRISKEIYASTKLWPGRNDGRKGLPDHIRPWSFIFDEISRRGKTLARIVNKIDPAIKITPTGRFKTAAQPNAKKSGEGARRGMPRTPLPDEAALIKQLDNFISIEKRYPGHTDGKNHLPEGSLSWATLRIRIREEYGLSLSKFHKKYKIDAFGQKIEADTPRKRYIREKLENGLSAVHASLADSQRFVAETVKLLGSTAVPDSFFDMDKNISQIAGRRNISQDAAKKILLNNPMMLLNIHNIRPAPAQKAADYGPEGIIAATLKRTIMRTRASLKPELMKKLVSSYHIFNEASGSEDDHEEGMPAHARGLGPLLSFVFEEKVKVTVQRAPKGTFMPDDVTLWHAIDACKREENILPRSSMGTKYLPAGSYSWTTVTALMKRRESTLSQFYLEQKPAEIKGGTTADFNITAITQPSSPSLQAQPAMNPVSAPLEWNAK